jgi:hypothetical protein
MWLSESTVPAVYRAEPYMVLSYHAEWLRDHWCERDVDPEVCNIMQQVAAFDYSRIAAEKADQGVPGGVSPECPCMLL